MRPPVKATRPTTEEDRRRANVYQAALRELRERHRTEFDAIYSALSENAHSGCQPELIDGADDA